MAAPPAVYVVHTRALVERRRELSKALDALGWSAIWIEHPDPRDLGTGWWLRHRPHPRLSKAQISVYLKHVDVLRRVRDGASPALVLEDDAVLPADFGATLDAYVAEVPGDFDLAFLGASGGMEATGPPTNRGFGRADRARSMSGYLVTPRGARRLHEAIHRQPLRLPIDLTVDDVVRRDGLQAYWSIPALIDNGSETGRFPGTVPDGAWRTHSAWAPARALYRAYHRLARSRPTS